MLSVEESAVLLGVSGARVRKLIADGLLPAVKIGKTWALREEDVMERACSKPAGGRPRESAGVKGNAGAAAGAEEKAAEKAAGGAKAGLGAGENARARHSGADGRSAAVEERAERLSQLYEECKEAFRFRPPIECVQFAQSREEAAFYMAVSDFFLKQRQEELVKAGVY